MKNGATIRDQRWPDCHGKKIEIFLLTVFRVGIKSTLPRLRGLDFRVVGGSDADESGLRAARRIEQAGDVFLIIWLRMVRRLL